MLVFNTETINAIAGLWKLVAVLGTLISLVVFRKPLHELISTLRIFKIKRGETEFSAERPDSAASKVVGEPIKEAAPPPEKSESTNQEEATDSHFSQMYGALIDKKSKEAEEGFAKLQAAETDSDKRLANEAIYLFFRYQHLADVNSIEKLEGLSNDPRIAGDAFFWLAKCYEYSGNYIKAIEILKKSLVGEPKFKGYHFALGARCYVKLGQFQDAINFLTAALPTVKTNDVLAKIYESLAETHAAAGDKVMRAIALQKALQYAPENDEVLFSAAYAQGDAGMPYLSLVNYNTLLRFQPKHATALNNLGVECARMKMPIKAVSLYSQAAELKETLAMSNLANKYLDEGFEKEATDILERAMKEKSPNKNVGQSWMILEDKREAEKELWKDSVNTGTHDQQFFWNYAEARYDISAKPNLFAGNWISPKGNTIAFVQNGSELTGKYEAESTGEEIVGQIDNRSVILKYRTKTKFARFPLWNDFQEGYAFLDASNRTIAVLFTSEKQSRSMSFSRKDN